MAKAAKEVIFIALPVVRSVAFIKDEKEIYLYGVETFGEEMAEIFYKKLNACVSELKYHYNQHPECRYLPTKGKMYRNIILGKYLVIYPVKTEKIEVLRAFHSSQSIRKIKTARSIKM